MPGPCLALASKVDRRQRSAVRHLCCPSTSLSLILSEGREDLNVKEKHLFFHGTTPVNSGVVARCVLFG